VTPLVVATLTGAPARLVIAVTVGSAVALIAVRWVRLPVRPIGEPADRAAVPDRRGHLGRPRSHPLAEPRRTSEAWNTLGTALRTRRRSSRQATPPEVVAAWCDEVARRCRGGSSLADAIVHSSPSLPSLRTTVDDVARAIQRGATLRAALDAADRPHDPALHLAVTVMAAAARVGGPAARPIDRAAGTLRLRHADALDRAAHSAQARMSAQVLTVVPVGALAVLATLDPGVRAVIVSPIGFALVAAGSTACALAWWWITRIVGATG
jgi:Flp pilus assembly protein TadB